MGNYVYLATNFKHKTNNIILSEDVLVRLYGLINMTAFKKNMTNQNDIVSGYEFGGWLLGYIDSEGNVNLIEKNEEDDYVLQDGTFAAFSGEKMTDEIFGNPQKGIDGKIYNPIYNCLVHVHTHPAETLSGRCFSEADLNFYKKLSTLENYHVFGCMLSTSLNGQPTDDDISFIKYDKDINDFYFYPNVYWKNKSTGEIKPLKQVTIDNNLGIRTVLDENNEVLQK